MNFRHTLKGAVASLAIAVVMGVVVQITMVGANTAHLSTTSEFNDPSGLAISAGSLWVTNELGNSVTEIDPTNGKWLATFGNTGGYSFNHPDAITHVGANLFVVNAGDSVTEMSAVNGSLVRIVSGPAYGFVDPIAAASSGSTLLVLSAGRLHGLGSITEINVESGALVRVIHGSRYAFAGPQALAASGRNVFVADERNNSVTEFNSASGGLVRVVSHNGLSQPDGIAVESGRVWVANRASASATEINAVSGAVISTYSDAVGPYGFWHPGPVIAAKGNVYVATPFGTSPMVTKVSATKGTPYWYMCNTNGPYYFTRLSAFAVSGNDLWVASRSGDNSQTPGAKTGSLTELLITSGGLVRTLPSPSGVTPTTTTTTTSTTTPTTTSTPT
jgi:hypothetical protein